MKTTAISMPSKAEAISGLKDYGMVTAGMLAAHALVKATKDNTMVNGGVALVGLSVALAVKNPLVKMLGVGAAVYGTIKLVSKVAAISTSPSGEGFAGILPEKAKELIRKFLPTISGIDEVTGIDDDLSGSDDELNTLSLDDLSMRLPDSESYHKNAFESVEGLGELMDMVG